MNITPQPQAIHTYVYLSATVPTGETLVVRHTVAGESHTHNYAGISAASVARFYRLSGNYSDFGRAKLLDAEQVRQYMRNRLV
jgi:hypothetical protein